MTTNNCEFLFAVLSTLLLTSICVVLYLAYKNKKLKNKTLSGAITGNRVTLSVLDKVYPTPVSSKPCGRVLDYIGIDDETIPSLEVQTVYTTFFAVSTSGRMLVRIDTTSKDLWVEPNTDTKKYRVQVTKLKASPENTETEKD